MRFSFFFLLGLFGTQMTLVIPYFVVKVNSLKWAFYGNVCVPFFLNHKNKIQIPSKSHDDLLTVVTFCKSSPQVVFLLTEKRKKGKTSDYK